MINIPGVTTRPAGRYTGTTEEVIEKLREDGYNVSWYKGTKKDLEDSEGTCGYFTVYLLESGWAWTLDRKGNKYLEYKRIKDEPRTYYCSGCRQRMNKGEMLGHRKEASKNAK